MASAFLFSLLIIMFLAAKSRVSPCGSSAHITWWSDSYLSLRLHQKILQPQCMGNPFPRLVPVPPLPTPEPGPQRMAMPHAWQRSGASTGSCSALALGAEGALIHPCTAAGHRGALFHLDQDCTEKHQVSSASSLLGDLLFQPQSHEGPKPGTFVCKL